VDVANFPISLNGIQIDNATREYPLIVFRDITYIPVTQGTVRFVT
jgi:hypothetical protein